MSEIQISLGEVFRDIGISDSLENANRANTGWEKEALRMLQLYLRSNKFFFMCEDIRKFAEMNGLPNAPNNRAWGAIICKATKQGLIEFVKYGKVKNPRAHMANAAVWRAKI